MWQIVPCHLIDLTRYASKYLPPYSTSSQRKTRTGGGATTDQIADRCCLREFYAADAPCGTTRLDHVEWTKKASQRERCQATAASETADEAFLVKHRVYPTRNEDLVDSMP